MLLTILNTHAFAPSAFLEETSHTAGTGLCDPAVQQYSGYFKLQQKPERNYFYCAPTSWAGNISSNAICHPNIKFTFWQPERWESHALRRVL